MKASKKDEAMLASIRAMAGMLDNGRMRDAIVRTLDGGDEAEAPKPLRQEVLSGNQAAQVLGLTRRMVERLAKQGHIRRVKLPGRERSMGYSRRSVEELAGLAVAQ